MNDSINFIEVFGPAVLAAVVSIVGVGIQLWFQSKKFEKDIEASIHVEKKAFIDQYELEELDRITSLLSKVKGNMNSYFSGYREYLVNRDNQIKNNLRNVRNELSLDFTIINLALVEMIIEINSDSRKENNESTSIDLKEKDRILLEYLFYRLKKYCNPDGKEIDEIKIHNLEEVIIGAKEKYDEEIIELIKEKKVNKKFLAQFEQKIDDFIEKIQIYRNEKVKEFKSDMRKMKS